MAKKTTKAKRPPSPYNQCMSTALKGKKGSKEEVRSNFKQASASCKSQSKKPLYSANPVYNYKCAYCGQKVTRQDLLKVDQKASEMDGEDLEFVYDQLPKRIGSLGEYVHDSNGAKTYNICPTCFNRADELSQMEGDGGDEDGGLGLAHDEDDDRDEDTDDFRNITYDAKTDIQEIDYEIAEIPDAVISYDTNTKILIVESRATGDYEFENVEEPMAFLKEKFPQDNNSVTDISVDIHDIVPYEKSNGRNYWSYSYTITYKKNGKSHTANGEIASTYLIDSMSENELIKKAKKDLSDPTYHIYI